MPRFCSRKPNNFYLEQSFIIRNVTSLNLNLEKINKIFIYFLLKQTTQYSFLQVLLSLMDNGKNSSHPRGLKSKSLCIKKYLKFPKRVLLDTVHVGIGIQFIKKWQNNKKIIVF